MIEYGISNLCYNAAALLNCISFIYDRIFILKLLTITAC
jgi:hypothetical protein